MNLDATLSKHIKDGPDRRSLFIIKDKKAEYRVKNKNKKEACTIQIDEGLINSNDTKKCDYGLCIDDNRFFLIELKGNDLSQACKQLLSTLNYMQSHYSNYDYFCRIVLSSSNFPYPSSYKKLLGVLKNPNKLRYKTHNLFIEEI